MTVVSAGSSRFLAHAIECCLIFLIAMSSSSNALAQCGFNSPLEFDTDVFPELPKGYDGNNYNNEGEALSAAKRWAYGPSGIYPSYSVLDVCKGYYMSSTVSFAAGGGAGEIPYDGGVFRLANLATNESLLIFAVRRGFCARDTSGNVYIESTRDLVFTNSQVLTCNASSRLDLSGPAETKPKYTGNWRELMMTATVTLQGQPAPGKQVNFKLTPKAVADGHNHGLPGKPSGTIAGGTTNAAGELKSPYLPSEFAGIYTLEASCDGCSNKATLDITVRVPDLVALGPDSQSPARYTLIGETTTHPVNHYFSTAAIQAFYGLLRVFQSPELNWGALGINDSSLVWGGRFDIGAGWSGAHHEHLEGDEVDISFYRPNGISAELRRKTYDKLAEGEVFKSPQTLWHVNDNPSTGSKAHFHVYLLGQKASFTLPY